MWPLLIIHLIFMYVIVHVLVLVIVCLVFKNIVVIWWFIWAMTTGEVYCLVHADLFTVLLVLMLRNFHDPTSLLKWYSAMQDSYLTGVWCTSCVGQQCYKIMNCIRNLLHISPSYVFISFAVGEDGAGAGINWQKQAAVAQRPARQSHAPILYSPETDMDMVLVSLTCHRNHLHCRLYFTLCPRKWSFTTTLYLQGLQRKTRTHFVFISSRWVGTNRDLSGTRRKRRNNAHNGKPDSLLWLRAGS